MYACHLVDIKATVLWNGIKPHEKSALMLIESWQSIEEVLIHLEDSSIRKKSFAVDLIFNFSRTKDGVIPPDDPIAAATAVATKKLGTATMKLQKEMEERAMLQGMTAERMSELQSLHLCEKRACRNFGQYCWNDETKNQHYPLNSAHFVTWNKALDDGISGVDSRTPPSKIRENLFSLNKGKKKTESSSPKQETSSQEMPFGGGHFIYQHPMYQHHSYQIPHSTFPPSSLAFPSKFPSAFPSAFPHSAFPPSAFYPSQYAASTLPDSRRAREETPLDWRASRSSRSSRSVSRFLPLPSVARSSPVEEDLEDYVSWLVQMKPHLKGVLTNACDRLMEGGYDLMTVQSLKGIEHQTFWQELGIPPGIGIQLARDVSKFGREMSRQMPLQMSRQMSRQISQQMPPPPPRRQRHLPTSQMATQAVTQAVTRVDKGMEDGEVDRGGEVGSGVRDTIEEDETHSLEYDYAEDEDEDYILCI